jgi:hypothetical protein
MATPAATLAQHIATTVGSLTYGTNCFSGALNSPDEVDIPVKAVFVWASGGPPPGAFLGETVSWKEISMTILVRGDKDDLASARDLAVLVWDATQYASLTGYFDVRCENPYPNWMKVDTERRHIYHILATATIKE